tara:strand:- start:137 stop:1834 length:1698 start_codon:yes stop_codon:yes gene_type:complete
MSSIYDRFSEERKKLQEQGLCPSWWSTSGYQLFKEKYQYQADNPKEQYTRIAKTLAVHTPEPNHYREVFFELMWKGWLSPSTPVLANCGTDRGLPVSCAGDYINDDLSSIYQARHETAMLTKAGFGTASYLGDVRPRGALISSGGKSSGVLPILKGFHGDMDYVVQGTARRGSWAGYLPIDHGDFDEVNEYLRHHPDGNNVGWNVSNEFIEKLNSGDKEAVRRYAESLKTKLITGKGYYWFNDKVNDKNPQWYKDQGLSVKSSQLCSEIALHSDKDHTFTCVLASMNLARYDEWKDTSAVQDAIFFLDSVCQEFIERAKNVEGLEKAVRFTKKSRALGLGVCGYHTYLQQNLIPFGSMAAHLFNLQAFKLIRSEAEEATKSLAALWGEPEWLKGYGRANTHLIAVAPTKSTALIMGGVSEGINPDTAMVYTQRTPAGEVDRVNPVLLEIMKERGVYSKSTLERIRIDNFGSVQQEPWLTDEEKEVFKIAFEINMHDVIRSASARSKYIDQWQSLNLFFAAGDDPTYINAVHKEAFLDPEIKGLYYVYSKAGIQASVDKDQCSACM